MAKKIGRPKGTGTGQQIVGQLRLELGRALDLNVKRGKALHILLADQIEEDAAGTLQKLSRFLPQEVDLGGKANEFTEALQMVSQRIAEANRLMDAKEIPAYGNSKSKQVFDIIDNIEDASED